MLFFIKFYLHSIRTRIKTQQDCLTLARTYSIFIPLEQGLRPLSDIHVNHWELFYLHSIRTRIKTSLQMAGHERQYEFYLHSIRTRIKTKNGFANHLLWINSIFIPLEQGLRLNLILAKDIASKFYLHSIRKTQLFCNLLAIFKSFHYICNPY